jgi:hypothetical protein
MFWKTKKRFEDQVRAMVTHTTGYSGANRRAINLIPLPIVADGHEIAQTQTVRYHHLLISIEGNQRTCCLKIISPKKRSRSALLIFRGRVVGCLYGRRGLDFQVMQQDAQMHAMSDLATPGNILDAYQLPEDLVLAAASLFHGQVLEFNQQTSPNNMLSQAVSQICSYSLPGCIVVNTPDNEMIFQVYLANGRVLGVYSSTDGWVAANEKTAAGYLNAVADPRIAASILPIRSIDDVAALGFSLTGLGDRRFQLIHQERKNIWSYDNTTETTENLYFESADSWCTNYSQMQKTLRQRLSPPQAKAQTAAPHYPNIRRLKESTAIRHSHSIHP